MKRAIGYLMAAAAYMGIAAGCIFDDGDGDGAEIKAGDRLPEFSVTMNDGTEVNFSMLEGTVSCIVFFHTGCPDCRYVMPLIQRLYDRFALESQESGGQATDRGVAFAVISRAEGEESVARHWKEEGFTMPYSAQDDKAVYSLFASSGVPRVYLSGRDGIIRFVHADDDVITYEVLAGELNSLL